LPLKGFTQVKTKRSSDPKKKRSKRKKNLRVGLFGTMLTPWRSGLLKTTLVLSGLMPIDNTDPRWPKAETAEEIALLLRRDHRLMKGAAVVIWHHDKDTEGRTARIELGLLARLGPKVIVHVEEGVPSREYMRAMCLLYPRRLYWVETLLEAATLAEKFIKR
jgi:hypothetical protein